MTDHQERTIHEENKGKIKMGSFNRACAIFSFDYVTNKVLERIIKKKEETISFFKRTSSLLDFMRNNQ